MPSKGVPVPTLAIAGAGAFLVWAGLKGVSAGSGLRALLTGHTPVPDGAKLVGTGDLGTDAEIGSIPVPANDSVIASKGLSYVGAGGVYRWGHATPAGWDCSGFVNWVINHDLGLDIPGVKGGKFTGRYHGPSTHVWPFWSGVVSIKREQVDAGDLVIWPFRHMGIAISNTRMVHAPGPNGTPAPVIGNIYRGAVFRRLRQAA